MFNSYEELKAAAEARRKDVLTLEIDMGGSYSPEYEQAKAALAEAKAMKSIVGQPFLGDDDGMTKLEERVASTKPESNSIWVQYSKLDLAEWSQLIQKSGLTPIDQYERVLPKTFIGVYGQDPTEVEGLDPLTTDARSMSTRSGDESLLPGGSLNSVIQSFMSWQNSGGDVNIRPTKSGLV